MRFSDIKLLLVICGMYVATGIWPRRWDRWLLRLRAALFFRFQRKQVERMAGWMKQVLGPSGSTPDYTFAAREHFRMCQETAWLRVRNIHGGASAEQAERIEIDGLTHLQQALAQGRGVILWGMLFGGYTIQKAALHRAGIRVSHLSRADHAAPSQSWLGLNVVAPLLRGNTVSGAQSGDSAGWLTGIHARVNGSSGAQSMHFHYRGVDREAKCARRFFRVAGVLRDRRACAGVQDEGRVASVLRRS